MLGCNKNYTTPALNCMLKSSKGTILVFEKKGRNNSIKKEINI